MPVSINVLRTFILTGTIHTMKIIDALYEYTQEIGPGIITDYSLFLCLTHLVRDGFYKEHKLRLRRTVSSFQQFSNLRSRMIRYNKIKPLRSFGTGVYIFPGAEKRSPEDLCCFVDPFCYISHFSAMQKYRLTNRNPKTLTFTTPTRALWNKQKISQIETDISLKEEKEIAHNLLVKASFAKQINKRDVIRHETRHSGESQIIRDSFSRISTIGQTFVDMLSHPHWCGGINHVLEVWEKHALSYLEQIIFSVNQNHSNIVKVRAGYILDEILEVNDQRIQEWQKYAQRGSSRKLDPQAPYKPIFSEKWMITLNV